MWCYPDEEAHPDMVHPDEEAHLDVEVQPDDEVHLMWCTLMRRCTLMCYTLMRRWASVVTSAVLCS